MTLFSVVVGEVFVFRKVRETKIMGRYYRVHYWWVVSCFGKPVTWFPSHKRCATDHLSAKEMLWHVAVFLCLQGGIFQQGIWRNFHCDDLLGKGYSAPRKYTRSDEVWHVRSAAIQHRLGYQLGAQSRLLYALSLTHLCYDEPRQASNRQVWQAQVCNSFNLNTSRLDE